MECGLKVGSMSNGKAEASAATQDGVFAESAWAVHPSDPDGLIATIREVGNGVPVVFLHGLVGLNEHWDAVVERVHHKMRCTLFELPLLRLRGEHCSIHGVTALTKRFLGDHFNEPCVLVGNSFGGHVAVRVALDRPDLVRGLVLAGSSGIIEKSLVSDVQIRPSRDWLRRKIGELFYDQTKMREADLERAHRELSDRGGARAMVKLSRSARRDHLGSRMREIAAPTLLIWGREDIVTPPEAAEQFSELISDSRLVWFDSCGHAPMIEKPELFADAMLEFAEHLQAAGSGA